MIMILIERLLPLSYKVFGLKGKTSIINVQIQTSKGISAFDSAKRSNRVFGRSVGRPSKILLRFPACARAGARQIGRMFIYFLDIVTKSSSANLWRIAAAALPRAPAAPRSRRMGEAIFITKMLSSDQRHSLKLTTLEFSLSKKTPPNTRKLKKNTEYT